MTSALTKKLIVFLTIVDLLFLVSYIYIFMKVHSSEAQSAQIYSQIGVNEEGQESFERLQNSIKESSSSRDKLASYFVTEDGIVNFLNQIESLGETSGASVELTSVNKQTDKNDSYLELSVKATGSFHDVYYFEALLESLPYKMSFSKVFLEKSGSGKTETTVHAVSGNVGVSKAPVSGKAQLPPPSNAGGEWSATIDFDLESFEPTTS